MSLSGSWKHELNSSKSLNREGMCKNVNTTQINLPQNGDQYHMEEPEAHVMGWKHENEAFNRKGAIEGFMFGKGQPTEMRWPNDMVG